MMARALVGFYLLWHGHLGLPGAGLLLRAFRNRLPALQNYPLRFDSGLEARLDFRDQASFSLLNYRAGDWGNHRFLFEEMAARLRPRAVLWDVGANVGLISLHFSKPAMGLKIIHAFEPSARPRKSLLSLFGAGGPVCVHPYGLGAKEEDRHLSGRGGDSSYGAVGPQDPAGGSESIRLLSGDALVDSGLEPPDLIKMDVEGHEPEVFAGLSRTIAKYRPVIFFEHIFLTPEQIRRMIPQGYRLSFLLDNGTWTEDFTQRHLGHEALLEPLRA